MGDLLYHIAGVNGKICTESENEDENFGTEQSHNSIIKFLGEEKRNLVLANLYMSRCDTEQMVRQAALHVWKVVVINTTKTLDEILLTLMDLVFGEKNWPENNFFFRYISEFVKIYVLQKINLDH